MNATFSKRVKALLATARVANVPSVVSNVWVGAVLGELVVSLDRKMEIGWPDPALWWLAAAGVCLYVAGNFLNDWYDREWDRSHRPERALPVGLFCPDTYLAIAVGLLIMAGICAWVVGPVALWVAAAILVFVVAYTLLHKRTGWGVVWIGCCRALLVVLGVTGMAGLVKTAAGVDLVLLLMVIAGIHALPLFCYIIGLSVSARFEAKSVTPEWARAVSLGMLVLPMGLVAGGFIHFTKSAPLLWALLPYAVWMVVCYRRKKHIPSYVSGLLAGIPLVDLMVLSASMTYADKIIYSVSPVVYVVPAIAFVMGLLLQRLAPAS